jgi:hypothetical protein
VRLQLQRDSLHRRVVSPRVWILQTRTWGIITVDMFTMISHYMALSRGFQSSKHIMAAWTVEGRR